MGEWSKKIGELGENIVADFFEKIGWTDAQQNINISCVQGKKHGNSGKEKNTHGIDNFFSYKSCLVDRTLDYLVVSVKYSASPYPTNPNTKFKEHFIDLAKTLECFRKSSLRNKAGQQFSGIENARNIGVLFWLSNDRNNQNIISKISSVRGIDEYNYETIFIVDDNRASFIFDSISFLKKKYANDLVEFYYPNTGRNINPTSRETSGKILPVEFINSPTLPFIIQKKDDTKIFVLTSIEKFHSTRLKRLIGLAQDITQNFATGILILFPDYDQLYHENQVSEAKAGFDNKRFTENVKVGSFYFGFRETE